MAFWHRLLWLYYHWQIKRKTKIIDKNNKERNAKINKGELQ